MTSKPRRASIAPRKLTVRCRRRTALALLCAVLCWMAPAAMQAVALAAQAAARPSPHPPAQQLYGPVREIVFSGNEDTSEVLLRDEIDVRIGDAYTDTQLAKARQALMDLGLFRQVSARAEQVGYGVRLSFAVDEKYYLLPLPRLSRNSEGDISLGGQLRSDNLLGLNHQFSVTLEREKADEGRGRETDRLRVDYVVPRLIGTRWGVNARIAEERYPVSSGSDTGVLGQWSRSDRQLRLGARRQLDDFRPSDPGWSIAFGIAHNERYHEPLDGGGGQRPAGGQDRSISLALDYNGVHQDRYRRFGRAWGGNITLGGQLAGGDYAYSSMLLYYRAYMPLDDVADNLNMSFRLGFANGSAWDLPRFSLGGSGSIRGIESGSLEGDTSLLYRVEWLRALRRHPRFRLLGFVDVGNAWPRYHLDLGDLEATLGGGFRWKIDAFVNTDLSIDIGYHPRSGDYKVYAGTSASF